MPLFHYKALDSSGNVCNGELEAPDRSDALRQLSKQGYKPIKVHSNTSEGSSSTGGKSPSKPKTTQAEPLGAEGIKLKQSEIILFTEELSDMIASGLQLEPALKVLESRSDKGHIKEVASRLRALVRDGMPFHQALRRVSPSFGSLYCSLTAAGEASGSLDKILKRQAEHLVTVQGIRSQVIGALIYPTFIILVVFGIVLFVLFYLLPQLVSLMKNMPGAKVPPMAQFLMGFSTFLSSYWMWIGGIILILVFAFKIWKDNETNKPLWDKTKLELPFVGPLLSANFHVIFMETLSNLIGNGLPLVRSLELSRDTTDNIYAQEKIEEIIDKVGDGRSLSGALLKSEIFPPVLVDMVVVGEQTGKLDNALANAARRSDKQLKNTISRLMALITPLILIILAIVIGSVLFLIFSLIGDTINGIRR